MSATRIAIIGGGASGALAALHVAREFHAKALPVEITLLERRPNQYLKGIAYSTPVAEHVLNVPAGNMSLYPDQPEHFRDWLRDAYGEEVLNLQFVPRRMFGRYIGQALHRELQQTRSLVHFRNIIGYVNAISRNGQTWTVTTAQGESGQFDEVILATGNLRPTRLPEIGDQAAAHPNYFSESWTLPSRDIPPDHSVLFIGSGLSMIDGVAHLFERGHSGKIVAFSRKGLVPRPHGHSHLKLAGGTPELPANARSAFRKIRDLVRKHEAEGGVWQDVFAAIRPVTSALWQAMPDKDRSRFLRHLKSYWEVHRHRSPVTQLTILEHLQKNEQLQIRAARLADVRPEENGFLVTWKNNGQTEYFDVIVNATGPVNDLRNTGLEPFKGLLAAGHVRPNRFGLGIEVSDTCQVLDASAKPQGNLHALGSLTKGKFWEITAVPDIRVQAQMIARTLAQKSPVQAVSHEKQPDLMV